MVLFSSLPLLMFFIGLCYHLKHQTCVALSNSWPSFLPSLSLLPTPMATFNCTCLNWEGRSTLLSVFFSPPSPYVVKKQTALGHTKREWMPSPSTPPYFLSFLVSLGEVAVLHQRHCQISSYLLVRLKVRSQWVTLLWTLRNSYLFQTNHDWLECFISMKQLRYFVDQGKIAR